MQQRARQKAHAEQQQVGVQADGVPGEGRAVVESASQASGEALGRGGQGNHEVAHATHRRVDRRVGTGEDGAERGVIYAKRAREPARLLAALDVGAEDDVEVVSIAQRSLSGLALPDGLVALGAGGRVAKTGSAPGALVARLDDGALFQLAGGAQ